MNIKYAFASIIDFKKKSFTQVLFFLVFLCFSKHGALSPKKSPGPGFTREQIKNALTTFRLYPFILTEIPEHSIELYFGEKRVNFGNRLYWETAKEEPTLVSWPANKDKEYILAALGPDGTGIYNVRCFFEHWLVGNIPGDDVSMGNVRSEYLGTVGNYHGIGWFRIIFLVFEQPEKNLTFDGEVLSIYTYGPIRESFNIKDFQEHYKLGPPFAINFCVVYNNNTELP